MSAGMTAVPACEAAAAVEVDVEGVGMLERWFEGHFVKSHWRGWHT